MINHIDTQCVKYDLRNNVFGNPDVIPALSHKMIFEAVLGLNNGKEFGRKGERCLRMNLACPRSVVEKAMSKMKTVF